MLVTINKYSAWINEPIGTTHMSYTDKFITTPRKETEAAKLCAALTRKKRQYMMLAGDFNATPDTPTIQKVSSILKDVGPATSQKTWTTKPFSYNGFEETELNWRLDYILASPAIEVISSEVLATNYSDHLPVRAVVDI